MIRRTGRPAAGPARKPRRSFSRGRPLLDGKVPDGSRRHTLRPEVDVARARHIAEHHDLPRRVVRILQCGSLVTPANLFTDVLGDDENRRFDALQRRNEALESTVTARASRGRSSPSRQAKSKARLERELFLRQDLLLEEGRLEGLSLLVVVDGRRSMAELQPVTENGADTRSGLFARTYAAEGTCDSRVANILSPGSKSSSFDTKPWPGFHNIVRSSKNRIVGLRVWSA